MPEETILKFSSCMKCVLPFPTCLIYVYQIKYIQGEKMSAVLFTWSASLMSHCACVKCRSM